MGDEATGLDLALAARAKERTAIEDAEERTAAFVVFELAGEAFAIEGNYIKAVLPMTEPFRVPACPPSLEGVVLYQGEIESVIDISGVIGRAPLPKAGSRAILLGQTDAMRSGIRVDRVVDVALVPESALADAPKTIGEALRDKASKVVERRGGLVPVLDLPAVFAAWERGEE